MRERISKYERKTKETDIQIKINIDGCGENEIWTTISFLDHILSLFSKHSLFDLSLKAEGDTEVDDHHLVEDCGICLGYAFYNALGDMSGIRRYSSICIPMDESLILVSVDISGRSGLYYEVNLKDKKIKEFDSQLVKEFLKAFVDRTKITLHLKQLSGENTHHIIEAIFKGLGVVLKEATRIDERIKGVPSTKGVLI